MRYKLLILMLLLILPVALAEKQFFDCEDVYVEGLCISVIFKSTSDKGSDFRNFNFPYNLKQGDQLWIEKIIAYNKDNKTRLKSDYSIDIYPLGGHIPELYSENYGKYIFSIPPLKPNDKYEYIYNGNIGAYQDYLNGVRQNITYRHWKIDVYKIGEWIITEEIYGEGGYSSLFNGQWKNNIFQVKDRPIVKTLRFYSDLIKDAIIILIGIGGIIVTIGIAKWQSKKKKEHDEEIQIGLLKSIETQLRLVEQSIEGHKEELNKIPPTIPSYFIVSLDSNFYITNLRYVIRKWETENLKEWIIKVNHKISEINRLIHLAQDFYSNMDPDTTKNPHVKVLRANKYGYYKDLQHLIKQLRSELGKIQRLKQPTFIQKKLVE